MVWLALSCSLLIAAVLAYRQSSRWTWIIVFAVFLTIITIYFPSELALLQNILIVFGTVVLIVVVKPLRTLLITDRLLSFFRRVLPNMSRTEKEALDAGSVWWDGQLFSGNPDWDQLLKYPKAQLSDDERSFIDNQVNTLCAMIDDWQTSQHLNDLSPEVWNYVRKNKFFGMIIPKEYGGLGFSAFAHSEVVVKISTRSIAAAVSVMVPNSLGPAELLLRYGTEEQKKYYLPRLANGDEIPCFALTSPEAGSDASSIPDRGVVCRGEYGGKKDVLGIRVTWDKRYITLGPVATVLGLAFQLYDPDHLLGANEELGITCALIPTNHPGVNIGRRHHPLGIAFQNGPNSGDDVFIPIEWIIGGMKQAGQGWRMLMECLAAGRSISLPALSVGGAKFSSRAVGAYARIRKQFRMPIGYFEGIEEPLARIGGYTYMMDAARRLTASALDQGESPSVISAILKYNLTERMRKAVNDAMDIQGGAGICLGPHNIFGKIYQAIPISITVEGANILTRSLIVYGQGAIRCHPYVLKEMNAAQDTDRNRASTEFDKAICGHIGFSISNFVRSLFLGITNSRLALVPVSGPTERYYQHLSRLSSAFAFVSDIAMLTLGGTLKRKEKLSGRLADVLGLLYLASATLKRYEDDGSQTTDLPLVHWAMNDCLFLAQESLIGIFDNFPNRLIGWFLRRVIFPFGRVFSPPSDKLGHDVARILLSPSDTRDRLTSGVFLPKETDEQVGRLEAALLEVDEVDKIEKRVIKARKEGQIAGDDMNTLFDAALRKQLITSDEAERLKRYDQLRKEIIKVDDFGANDFRLDGKGV